MSDEQSAHEEGGAKDQNGSIQLSPNESVETITDSSLTSELGKPDGTKRRRGRPRRQSRNQEEEAELKKKEEEERKVRKKTQLDLYNHAEQLKLIQQQCVIAEKQHAALQRKVNSSQLQKQLTLQTIPLNVFMHQLNQMQNVEGKERADPETQHQQPYTSNDNISTESNNILQEILDKMKNIEKKQQEIEKKFETGTSNTQFKDQGNLSRGNNSQRISSRGNNSQRISSQGNSSRGNSSRGNSSRGNSSRGNSSRGNSLRGNSSRGNSSRGNSSRGNSWRGNSWRSNSSRGKFPQCNILHGNFQRRNCSRMNFFRPNRSNYHNCNICNNGGAPGHYDDNCHQYSREDYHNHKYFNCDNHCHY